MRYWCSRRGSDALNVRMIEADLSSEVVDPLAPVAPTEVGVRQVLVPSRGDRGRGALVLVSVRRNADAACRFGQARQKSYSGQTPIRSWCFGRRRCRRRAGRG